MPTSHSAAVGSSPIVISAPIVDIFDARETSVRVPSGAILGLTQDWLLDVNSGRLVAAVLDTGEVRFGTFQWDWHRECIDVLDESDEGSFAHDGGSAQVVLAHGLIGAPLGRSAAGREGEFLGGLLLDTNAPTLTVVFAGLGTGALLGFYPETRLVPWSHLRLVPSVAARGMRFEELTPPTVSSNAG